MSYLLRGQRSLPKWHHREGHPQPPREREEAAPLCATAMASYHPLGPLAICSKEHVLPS
jgi:hypothetical protein